MSTVKLVTPYNAQLHEALVGYPNVRVLVATSPAGRRLALSKVIKRIFTPYEGKLVIFGDFAPGELPVNEHAYMSTDDIARSTIDDIVYGVLHNSSQRTYSADGVTYYDVYRVWSECRSLQPVRRYVPALLKRAYGTTDVKMVAPWEGKTIGEMMTSHQDDEDYKRILAADLQYPVILRWGDHLVDGNHRLIKCAIIGRKYISAIVIPGDRLRKCKITVPIDEYEQMF